MPPLRFGLIGTGRIALANHVRGLATVEGAELTALCDADPATLARASQATGVDRCYHDGFALIEDAPVDAVIIATPNDVHRDLAVAAAGSGRHVLCEKPLALNAQQAREMLDAAEAAGVRHMTAFTYRFVPGMRYLKHLVDAGALGRILHFRAQRFQDWGRRYLGWRQQAARAGCGELGDMLSHRIDFAHHLVGPLAQVFAASSRVWDTREDEHGVAWPCDVEDWVAAIGRFETGATAVFESTKTATGLGEGGRSRDWCELNGTSGSAAYRLDTPHHIVAALDGGPPREMPVPEAFLKVPGSLRDPSTGDPLQDFRYDQTVEFVRAIREGRPCAPSFADGLRAQIVMDAMLESARTGATVDLSSLAV